MGPADWNFDETMSTLRYANRAKNIKNKPKINEDPKDAMLREFQEEIARLKAALADAGGGAMEEYVDEHGQVQVCTTRAVQPVQKSERSVAEYQLTHTHFLLGATGTREGSGECG